MNGRNLLRFTGSPTYAGVNSAANLENGWCTWLNTTGYTVERTEEGIKFTAVTASGGRGFVIPLAADGILHGGSGEVLTLSFQYRGSIGTSQRLYLMAKTGGNAYRFAKALTASETEWQTFTETFYFPSIGTRESYAILFPYTDVVDAWFEVKDGTMKLEYGTTATPWRPAPEDLATPSDLVYASEGVDLGDTSGLATDAAARGYASDAQAAAISAAATDATSKADAAQSAAISAAAADATSKANAAQAAAEATASADATAKANAAQAAAEATASADATSKAGAAEAAAKAHADAQVATRARTFATGWEYRQTADAAVVEGKTYYTRSGADPDWEWTAVENPVDADIATYWELLPERPVPPYDPGDVWLQGDGGAILACTAAKAAGEAFSEDDWTLASGYTDDAAAQALEGGIEALRESDAAMSARMDGADEANRAAMAAMDGRVASAEAGISGVASRLVSLEDYVRIVGGTRLELGKYGSAVTASLENDRLAFLMLGQDAPVAYIAADEDDGTGKLFVTQAVVVSELQFGHGKWAWTERKNGNMALKWRGGDA